MTVMTDDSKICLYRNYNFSDTYDACDNYDNYLYKKKERISFRSHKLTHIIAPFGCLYFLGVSYLSTFAIIHA